MRRVRQSRASNARRWLECGGLFAALTFSAACGTTAASGSQNGGREIEPDEDGTTAEGETATDDAVSDDTVSSDTAAGDTASDTCAGLARAASGGGVLRSAGSRVWQSRAGLRYGADPNFGNRVRHVLNHAADIPSRSGAHGVLDAGRRGALGVVDEAWQIAQRGGSGVSVSTQGTRTVYTVDMGRRVGFVGGRAGAAAGNPAASHLRLVVQGGRDIITAFPVVP